MDHLAILLKTGVQFGFRQVYRRVLPPTQEGLSDAFIAACERTNEQLGSGFGDTLSTITVGRYEKAAEFATYLVMAVLVDRADEFARACVEAAPDDFDEAVIGVDPTEFMSTLAVELHDEVRGRAANADSPLFGWLDLLQGDATLRELRDRLADIGRRIESRPDGAAWLRPTPRRPPGPVVARAFLTNQMIEHLDGCGHVTLQGPAGMGKTTLALAAMCDLEERYPGGVIELELGPEVTSAVGANSLAQLLVAPAFGGRPDEVPGALTITAPQAIRTLLSQAGRLAVIVDDAWSAAPVEALLACLPRSADVVVTTRDQFVAHRFGPVVAVEELEADEAQELVERRLPGASSAAVDVTIAPPASTVGEALGLVFGYHALALDVACSTIVLQPPATWPGEVRALAEALATGRAQGWRPGWWQTGDRRVPAALERSYRYLAALPNGIEACACYRSLGALADAPSIAAAAVEAVLPTDHRAEAIDLLSRLALVKQVGGAQPARVSVHSVIRSDALARQDENERERLAGAHAVGVLTFVRDSRDNRSQVFNDVPSIRHAWTQLTDAGVSGNRADFLTDVLPVLDDLGLADDADRWTNSVLEAQSATADTGRALNIVNRARAHVLMSRMDQDESKRRLRDALACYDEALPLYRPDPANYAMTLNNKGAVLRDLAGLDGEDRPSRLRDALACYDEVLPLRQAYSAEYAMTLNNKGNVLWDLAGLDGEDRLGRLRDALACYDEALPLRQPYPARYAMTLNNKGAVLRDLADLDDEDRPSRLRDALACYDEALPLRQPYPADYAMTLNNKGAVLSDLADLDDEDRPEHLRDALDCYEEALPLNRPYPTNYAMTLVNKGNVLQNLAGLEGEDRPGRLRDALACYDEALPLCQPYPTNYATTLNNKGHVLQNLAELDDEDRPGRLRDALACYDEALPLYRPYPAHYATALNNKGNVLQDLAELDDEDRPGRLRDALACYDEALPLRQPYPARYAKTLKNKNKVLAKLAGLEGDEGENPGPP